MACPAVAPKSRKYCCDEERRLVPGEGIEPSRLIQPRDFKTITRDFPPVPYSSQVFVMAGKNRLV